MPTINWIYLYQFLWTDSFHSGKSKSHTGLWNTVTLISLLAECMSLYRETKKKVIGGVVARSIGYQWPSPPFFAGGTLPFLVPCPNTWLHKLGTSFSRFVPDTQRMPYTFYCSRGRMLSERLFSSHKFLLELLRNRVTTPQKHCTAVSKCFDGFKLWYGMPSTTSKCYGICERMSVFRLNGDHRDWHSFWQLWSSSLKKKKALTMLSAAA